MAESNGSMYNLSYFSGNVPFADSESFRESDKKRFFQFCPQDSLTTVALSKVRLTVIKKEQTQVTGAANASLFPKICTCVPYVPLTRDVNELVTRDESVPRDESVTRCVNVLKRSNVKDGHAEKQTVHKIKQMIKKLKDSGAKLETLTLVMNITYSPCNDVLNNCQDVLQQFFMTLGCNITFVLRFAYLYHEKGVRGDDGPIKQLANWMIALERAGFAMRVESIEVTKELSCYSPRDETKWEEVKKKREEKDKAMKDIVTQVYTRKREIEEENRKRDPAVAIPFAKMTIEDRVLAHAYT